MQGLIGFSELKNSQTKLAMCDRCWHEQFLRSHVFQVMTLIPKTQDLQKVLVYFFRLNPSFLLGEAFIEMTRFYFEHSLLEVASGTETSSQASMPSAVGNSIQSFVQNVTSSLNVTTAFNFSMVQPQGTSSVYRYTTQQDPT